MSNTSVHDDEIDLEDLELQEGEDESELVKRLRGTIRGQRKELKDLRPLKDRVAEIEIDNSLSKAFQPEELEALTQRQRDALVREVGDDKTPEALRKAAEEFKWVEPKQDPIEQELEGHERVENAGNGARGAAGAVLDAETVGSWPMDKMLRFKEQHPDAWEAIKRGEAVNGITF